MSQQSHIQTDSLFRLLNAESASRGLQTNFDISYLEAYDEIFQGLYSGLSTTTAWTQQSASQTTQRDSPAPSRRDLVARPTSILGLNNDVKPRKNARSQQRNREAQRAFRQRKERQLQDLTAKVQELEQECNSIKEERDQLRIKLNNFLNNRSSEQGLLSSPFDTFRLDQHPVKNTYESERSITPPSHSMDGGFESFNHAHLEA